MIRKAAALCVLLAGCQTAPIQQGAIPLRNPTAPVASVADLDEARFAGRWTVIEVAGVAEREVVVGAQAIRLGETVFARVGEARYRSEDGDLWVHWVAQDGDMAALGDPAGRLVFLMARGRATQADRRKAARHILTWYGYDVARMTPQP